MFSVQYCTFVIVVYKLCVLLTTADNMEYTLSDEFCRKYFLVGVLLREVRARTLSSIYVIETVWRIYHIHVCGCE